VAALAMEQEQLQRRRDERIWPRIPITRSERGPIGRASTSDSGGVPSGQPSIVAIWLP
jgi:hypothetical protein